MKDISVSQGYLYATIIEGVLYVFNVALFVYYLYATLYKNKGRPANNVVISFVCLIFILSTAHLTGSICSILEGFIVQDKTPDTYFKNRAHPLSLVNKSLYGATLVIGDALLIYRVWALYERSWKVVVLPVLTLLGTMVCAALIVWGLSQLKPDQTIFQPTIMATAPAMFALPFMTNVMITTLILVRMKKAKDNIGGMFAYGIGTKTMDTIYNWMVLGAIESCVIYPLFLLLAIILYFLETNVLLLVTGSMTQVVAIVPTLMWLQIVLGLSRCDGAARRDTAETASIGFRTGIRQNGDGNGVEEIAMTRLEEGSNLESQSRISAERSVAGIETIPRTDVTQTAASSYRGYLQGRSSWPA